MVDNQAYTNMGKPLMADYKKCPYCKGMMAKKSNKGKVKSCWICYIIKPWLKEE